MNHTHNQGQRDVLDKLDMFVLAAAMLAMYVPTYLTLDRVIWGKVGQGHGPVMLALTLWLAWQRRTALALVQPVPQHAAGWALIVFGLALYVLGRSQDILMFDVGSQIPLLVGGLLAYSGINGLKKMWFPIFFLIFIVPLPSPVVDALTGPLKAAVSVVAEELLHLFGFPVGRSGVTLTVGPYKLMVADACAGLNSIFALEAVGVFYLSLMPNATKARKLLLAACILPISFVSNVVRVMALVLVTYYFGDEAGQGFVHGFAGILLFVVATVLTIGADGLIRALSGIQARHGKN